MIRPLVSLCWLLALVLPGRLAAQGEVKLLAGHGAGRELFGSAVSIAGDRAVVGAPCDNAAGRNDAGAAYVYRRDGAGWVEEAKLTAGDGAAEDQFGASVALEGNRILIGAPGDYANSHARGYAGAAYVFEWDGTRWAEKAKLTAGDGAAVDQFGSAVALSGERAVVAAPLDDDRGAESGALYVFTRSGAGWTQTAKLTARDGAVDDRFGLSVALDGDHLVAASPGASFGTGAAYTFRWDGTAWTPGQTFLGFSNPNYRFGTFVALDGGRFIVDGGVGNQVDVFEWSGSAWARTAELVVDAQFIGPVAVEAGQVVIGAQQDGVAGAAFVFQRDASGWRQVAKLTPGDGSAGDGFGQALDVDGGRLFVGAPGVDDRGDEAGAAYVFERQAGRWAQAARLTAGDAADDGGFDLDDSFGLAVALDGDRVLVGTSSGAAYAFAWNGVGWTEAARLTPGTADARFGLSVALDGDRALIGGDYRIGGSARVFEEEGAAWREVARLQLAAGAGGAVALDGDRALVAPFVFERVGTTWVEQAMLTPDGDFSAVGEPGGVALDGHRIVLGTQRFVRVPGHPSDGFFERAVSVFEGERTRWEEVARLKPGDAGEHDGFGRAVALDGDRLLVGSSRSAYLFEWDGARWVETAQLASDHLPEPGDFGLISVALQGRWALVGRPEHDAGQHNAGAVYLYYLDGTSWKAVKKLAAGDASVDDVFGWDVAIDGERFIAGAPGDDDNGFSTGAAYLYDGLDALVTSAEEPDPVPARHPALQVHQNYPNPFEEITTIAFTLEKAGAVRLEVVDLLGRTVAVLVDGRVPAGRHDVVFDGRGLPGGVYFYRVQAGGDGAVKKLVRR